jgi:hypothetical protein
MEIVPGAGAQVNRIELASRSVLDSANILD